MPQACGVLDLIGRYGRDFIPIPRRTERYWWSVSCLPATPGKALVRVNASWMELFSIHADGADLRGTFLLHLSDFTTDRSPHRASVDQESASSKPSVRYRYRGEAAAQRPNAPSTCTHACAARARRQISRAGSKAPVFTLPA